MYSLNTKRNSRDARALQGGYLYPRIPVRMLERSSSRKCRRISAEEESSKVNKFAR